jgi:outer membrane protein
MRGADMTRFTTIACAALMAVFVAGTVSAQDLKIVYIDSQKVLADSQVGKEAFTKLKTMSEAKEADLKKKEAKIKGLSDQLQAKAATMKPEAKDDLQKQYEREVKDFNRAYKEAQEDLRSEEMKILKPWTKDLEDIIKDYGKKNKIDLILDRTNPVVVYASDRIDITAAIVDLFDKHYQQKKSK